MSLDRQFAPFVSAKRTFLQGGSAMRNFTIPLLVLLLILTAATPASADQPQYWYDEDFDYTFPLVDCGEYGYDFVAMVHSVGHHSELLYFDRAGNVVRTLYQTQGTDYVYNSEAPNIGASGAFRYSVHVTPLDPTFNTWLRRYTGIAWNITLPGYGTVIHVSGQDVEVVENWVVVGTPKSVGLHLLDFPALCAGLAG
jgi:hypothetical protein